MGLNSVNDNLIFMDRKSGGNFSGLILGAEHSGKTFQMKREIFGGMLSPDDRVYVVAVIGEYDDFIRRQGGRKVRPERWNPFYMTEGYGLIEGQEKVKARFLRALLPYVTNVEPSKGLVLTSASNVPFDDNFLGREDPFVELFL